MTPLIEKLLSNRGITDEKEIKKFLNPDYDNHLHDPFLLPDMEKAVARILKAIKGDEKVVFFTDYDTDGIPAGVILHDFFKEIGYKNFENYIPHRNNEGYGLNIEAIERFNEDGATLIVTADCGISDIKEVECAQNLGIDVIITDHHLSHKELPKAYAVVNPKRADSKYPFDMLCGAGVVFKLIQALIKRGNEQQIFNFFPGREKWFLDMVAIATISDMVPLVGENRVLAHYGIKVLRKSPRPGLKILLRRANIKQAHLTEDDISFVISPRINVTSRIDTPFKAFQLLSTRDEAEAEVLVKEINKLNNKRKGLVASALKEARKKIDASEDNEILVLGNPNWYPGILGLVAHKLMEEFSCPVFVWGKGEGKEIKGSCRSDGSVNIVQLMENIKGSFLDFGGHEYSGGFSISNEKIHFLEEKLLNAYRNIDEKSDKPDDLEVDCEFSLGDVHWNTFGQIEKLAPFGEGNPKPIFLFKNITLLKIDSFGKEKNHIRLDLENQGRNISAIKFFATPESFDVFLKEGEKINLGAFLEKNVFMRTPELRLRIVNIT